MLPAPRARFSIFFRDAGDSFTSAGRLTFACVLLLSGYMISALFYGNNSSLQSDIGVAVVTAAIMFPITLILQYTFQGSRKERVKKFLYKYAKELVYGAFVGA